MTTIRSEETTIPVVIPEDQTVIVKDDELFSSGSSFPASSTTVRTSEGKIHDLLLTLLDLTHELVSGSTYRVNQII